MAIVWYACGDGGLEKANVATSIVIELGRGLIYICLSMRSGLCCVVVVVVVVVNRTLGASWICDKMRRDETVQSDIVIGCQVVRSRL
jgi:hypothetical protein